MTSQRQNEMSERGRGSREPGHPDFSQTVLDDLYRYPRKRRLVAWALWAVTGILGGHRFYLDRTGTGIVMLLTGGGALIWWIVDAFLLPGMIARYNQHQEQRERAGLPPVALSFMPAIRDVRAIRRRPEWAEGRAGSARLIGDALVLIVAGSALGGVSAEQGNFEALTAVLILIATTSLGARWDELAQLPVLRELDRWSHRLRLFYHANYPGGPLSLLVRPIVGPATALFSKRARAEVRLYLQLGAVFAMVFTLLDLPELVAASDTGIEASVGVFIEDVTRTFLNVYAFATPIGATLTAQLLLERTDWVLWALSGLSVGAIIVGLFV